MGLQAHECRFATSTALQAAEKLNCATVLKGHGFSRAAKPQNQMGFSP
jgi:hypothetical protein